MNIRYLTAVGVVAVTTALTVHYFKDVDICIRGRQTVLCSGGFIQEPIRNDDCKFEHSVASGTSTNWDRQLIYMHVASSPKKLCRWISDDFKLAQDEDCELNFKDTDAFTVDYSVKGSPHYICVKESYGTQCLDLYDITER